MLQVHPDECDTQRSTAQHSTAQRIVSTICTAQHSTAQHSTAQHGTAQHSTAYCVHHMLTGTARAQVFSYYSLHIIFERGNGC